MKKKFRRYKTNDVVYLPSRPGDIYRVVSKKKTSKGIVYLLSGYFTVAEALSTEMKLLRKNSKVVLSSQNEEDFVPDFTPGRVGTDGAYTQGTPVKD